MFHHAWQIDSDIKQLFIDLPMSSPTLLPFNVAMRGKGFPPLEIRIAMHKERSKRQIPESMGFCGVGGPL
jgi:hypothetical protein